MVFRAGGKVVESPAKPRTGYEELVKQIVRFFETKQPPVPNSETLELFAFMDAAQRSKQAGGAPTKLRQCLICNELAIDFHSGGGGARVTAHAGFIDLSEFSGGDCAARRMVGPRD